MYTDYLWSLLFALYSPRLIIFYVIKTYNVITCPAPVMHSRMVVMELIQEYKCIPMAAVNTFQLYVQKFCWHVAESSFAAQQSIDIDIRYSMAWWADSIKYHWLQLDVVLWSKILLMLSFGQHVEKELILALSFEAYDISSSIAFTLW